MRSRISACELWMEQYLLNSKPRAFVSQAPFALKSHIKPCCCPGHRDPRSELGLQLLPFMPGWSSEQGYAMHGQKGIRRKAGRQRPLKCLSWQVLHFGVGSETLKLKVNKLVYLWQQPASAGLSRSLLAGSAWLSWNPEMERKRSPLTSLLAFSLVYSWWKQDYVIFKKNAPPQQQICRLFIPAAQILGRERM